MASGLTALHQIDHLLTALTAAWEELPEVASEFAAWPQIDQVDFAESWSINNVLSHRLEEYLQQTTPTTTQQARYRALHELMERNQPYLKQILC
jgi:hypothetical protein